MIDGCKGKQMHKRTIAISEVGLRAIKHTAIELDIWVYDALDRILKGDKKALDVAKRAYRKFNDEGG